MKRLFRKKTSFKQGFCAIALVAFFSLIPVVVQADKEKEKSAQEALPAPTVLDSARFLVLREGNVVQFGRFKVVRSNHSGRTFAGGLQRALSEPVVLEAYEQLKGKARRKLFAGKHGHHFEFTPEGEFQRYRGWSVEGVARSDFRLIRRGDEYVHRTEGSGGAGTNKLVASVGAMPFDAGQFVLVRMAFQRARRAGGTLPVIHPKTGEIGSLTVALGEGNQYTISGLGQSGRVIVDDSGRIITYHFGDLEFFREGSR